MYLCIVSTLPSLLNPTSRPDNQIILDNIQSFFVCNNASSGLKTLFIDLLAEKTVYIGRLSPILALIICLPRGVLKLFFCWPIPFFAVEIENRLIRISLSYKDNS